MYQKSDEIDFKDFIRFLETGKLVIMLYFYNSDHYDNSLIQAVNHHQ